jgi:CDP-diacylglycerol--glycerol-3-phosphate 3-phosphatidyltransferase
MSAPPSSPVTFSDRVRAAFARITAQAGARVHGWGVHPDTITIVGTGVVALAAVCIGAGQWFAAGLLLLLSLPLDALDGAVARAMGRTDRRGAVLDSTLDRYADGFIFAGFAYYFASFGERTLLLLTFAALIGTFVVSYVRARAGEADLSVKIGLFSRFERVLVLLAMLLLPFAWAVPAGMVVLAVGTNVTGVQRLLYVYRHLDRGS